MKSYLLSASILLSFTCCSNESQNNKSNSEGIETITSVETYKKNIIGNWVSSEDPKVSLVINDTEITWLSIDESNTGNTDVNTYEISNKTCDESKSNSNSATGSNIYLRAVNIEDSITTCYVIDNLSDTSMTLMYVANGGITTYHRSK